MASVEDMIKKRVWGALVCDWVRKRGNEEDYIRLYESQGALRWHLDFVIPEKERERQKAKLLDMMSEIERINNKLATTTHSVNMKVWWAFVRNIMRDADELRVSIAADGDRGIDHMLLHESEGALR